MYPGVNFNSRDSWAPRSPLRKIFTSSTTARLIVYILLPIIIGTAAYFFLAKKPVLRSLAINALPRRFIAGFRDFIFAQIGKWVLLGE
jgi:hypothetical protein